MFGTEPAPEGLNIYSKNETKMILRRITMVINEINQLPALPGKKMRGRMVDEETEGRRDGGTKRRRDEETKRRRDEGTKRRRDDETKGQRDEGTKRRRDKEIIYI
jgi:hypothetical protein